MLAAKITRRRWLGGLAGLGAMSLLGHAGALGLRADDRVLVDAKLGQQVERILADYFAHLPDYEAGDLLSRDQVQRILARIKQQTKWVPRDANELVEDTLPAGSPLVQTLRTRDGRRFMRKVAGYEEIYSRLDRISEVSGGKQMLQALVRLPDGERYAVADPPRGVPNLLDLLPKNRTGRTRTIKDYDEPTGKIYTQEQLAQRLADSLQAEAASNAS